MKYFSFLKQTLFIVLFVGFIGGAFAFPDFEFNEGSVSTDSTNISFKASSGVGVSLKINGEEVGKTDVVAPRVEISLDGSITDEVVPIYSRVVFVNNHPTQVYKINITGKMFRVLNPGQSSSEVVFDEVKNFEYRDEEAGVKKVVVVENKIIDGSIGPIDVSTMKDGLNVFSFTISSPYNDFTSVSKEFSFNFEKFSNSITVDSFPEASNKRTIYISGSVADPSYPLYYVVNIDGMIGNLGVMNKVAVKDGKFNASVENLNNGDNSIRFISTEVNNGNVFTGETKVNVLVDTVKPVIKVQNLHFASNVDGARKAFLAGNDIDTNSNSISLNVSAKASKVIYTFNGKEQTQDFTDDTFLLTLNGLKDGKNDLEIVVKDEAGNIAHSSHQIIYDSVSPDIEKGSLDPEELFSEGESHFFLQKISGKTNKPGVKMVIFTIPVGSKDSSGNSISCESYTGAFSDINVSGAQVSLVSLINQKTEITSGTDKDFDAYISFQEGEYKIGEENKTKKVGSVKTKNKICIVLSDKYGRSNVKSYDITFDAGNTAWRQIEVSTLPNTVYQAEILLVDSNRGGKGSTEVGITAKFSYIGSGEIATVTSVNILKDSKLFPDTKKVTIQTDRVNKYYNPDTGVLLVYFPVSITGYANKTDELFESIELGFGLNLVYSLTNSDIPIDIVNPVWFQTKITVENSFDWLTPKQIEKWQAVLNKTIGATEKVVKFMKKATVYGVVYCVGSQLWHGVEMASLSIDDKDSEEYKIEKRKIDRRLYIACDRIAGLPAPYTCDAEVGEAPLTSEQYKHGIDYTQNGKKVGKLKDITVGGDCNIATGKVPASGEKSDGVFVSGEGVRYKESSGNGITRTVNTTLDFEKTCLPIDANGAISFNKFKGTVCYAPGADKFDDTKCNFFGLDTKGDETNNWNAEEKGDHSGVSGKASSTSILSSIRCGAIADTYSHSKNLLKIQKGIYLCLEQAKVGTVKGSYCQRLFAQAICDIATNIILPELKQTYNPQNQGASETRSPIFDFLGKMEENQQTYSKRYEGSILSKSGLQSGQIINKACFGAITGDWSALTENILTSIEENEVEPTFGPAFAESKLQGYDPITGALSIRYLFSYGVLSGGQAISTKVELYCDNSASSNEYCPDDGVVMSVDNSGGTFKTRTLTVAAGGSAQRTEIISETSANIWYNKLKMTHTYTLKGKTETFTQVESILHKEEVLPVQCHWTAGVLGSGAGFSCDKLFDIDVGLQNKVDSSKSKLLPSTEGKTPIFYPSTKVILDLTYQSTGNKDLSLVYYSACNVGSDNEYKLNANGGGVIGILSLKNLGDDLSKNEAITVYDDLPDIGTGSGFVATATLTPNLKYYVMIKNPKDIELAFTKLEIGGKKVSPVHTTPYSGYELIEISETQNSEGGEVRVYFTNDMESSGLLVSLISDSDKLNLDDLKLNMGSSMGTSEYKVMPGECSFNYRLIPSAKAAMLSVDEFATYNPNVYSDKYGNEVNGVGSVVVSKLKFELQAESSNTGTKTTTNEKGETVEVINADSITFNVKSPSDGRSLVIENEDGDNFGVIIPTKYVLAGTSAKLSVKFNLKVGDEVIYDKATSVKGGSDKNYNIIVEGLKPKFFETEKQVELRYILIETSEIETIDDGEFDSENKLKSGSLSFNLKVDYTEEEEQ